MRKSMKLKIRSIIFIAITILVLPLTALGADNLYRLMHNDQQALVIAEVIESNKNSIEFRVEKSITSDKDLNESAKIKQLEIENFKLNKSDLTSVRFYEEIDKEDMLKKGDIYLVSLNKKLNGYEVAWGIYKLSSLDYKTLDVLYPESTSSIDWRVMEAMSVKEFINSDGRENEFSFDGEKNILKSGDRVVYDGKSTENSADIEKAPIKDVDKIVKDPDLGKEERNYGYLIYIAIGIVSFILFKKIKYRRNL